MLRTDPKTQSNFFKRNLGKIIAAVTIPSILGGGIGAGLLWGGFLASFVVSPVGPLAYLAVVGIGAAAFFAVSAIITGITFLVKRAKQKEQLAQEKQEIDTQKPTIEHAIKEDTIKDPEAGITSEKPANQIDANASFSEAQDVNPSDTLIKTLSSQPRNSSSNMNVVNLIAVENLETYCNSIDNKRKQADKDYIDTKFQASTDSVNNSKELSSDAKKNLEESIRGQKEKMLNNLDNYVKNKSDEEIRQLVDAACKGAFASQVATIINETFYKADDINFAIILYDEDNAQIKAIQQEALIGLEKQKLERLNQFAHDYEVGKIKDLATCLEEERKLAKDYQGKVLKELQEELTPERLAVRAAESQKKDLTEANKNIEVCQQPSQKVPQSPRIGGFTQSSLRLFKNAIVPVAEPVISADTAMPRIKAES